MKTLGEGEDRAQPSRGTGRESIPDAAGAAKATTISPVADESASSPDPSDIRDALWAAGITADRLFDRIREDIERGLIREARAHLNFVDGIVNANAESEALT